MDYHRPAPHSAGPASLINDTGIPALSALLKPLDNRLFWPAVAIGGPDKQRACTELGAARAIDYRREDFAARVRPA